MNFVLNIDPAGRPVAVADVSLKSAFNAGEVRGASVAYLEFRYDEDSRQNFVCMVYRLPSR